MVWSYSQAFEDAVSMKDAILNKAVLIQMKGINFTGVYERSREMPVEKQNLRKGAEAGNRDASGLTSNANIKVKMAKCRLVEKGAGLSS